MKLIDITRQGLIIVGMMGAFVVSSSLWGEELAKVNGVSITDKEFKEELDAMGPRAESVKTNPEAKVRFLEHVITTKLLAKAGKEAKIESSPSFVSRIESLKKQVLAQEYLETEIEKRSNDKNLKEYFEKNKSSFGGGEVCASHILLDEKDEAKAKKLLEEAKKKDADFGELAKKNSTGPSAPKGGDLGCFGKGRMVPEFETAAFATKDNTVHPNLVKTQFGWHIIKVKENKSGQPVKFADVKEKVKSQYKREAQKNLIDDLKKAANIKIHEEKVKNLKF